MSIASSISAAFGEITLYAILGVEANATVEEIKKGYRKKALIHHPDKGGDVEKFKALSMVHSILSSEEGRKLYDDTGEIDGDDGNGDINAKSFDEWYQYFRTMFPVLNASAIDAFSEMYKDSYEERFDILRAYSKHRGNIQRVFDTVMLLEEGEEFRVCEIISEAIKTNEVKSFPQFVAFKKTLPVHPKVTKSKVTALKSKKSASDENDNASLVTMLRARNEQQMYDSLLDKYGGQPDKKKSKGSTKSSKSSELFEDIPDEEFNRLRDQITSKKK